MKDIEAWGRGFMLLDGKKVPINWRPVPKLKPADISAASRFALTQPDVRVMPRRVTFDMSLLPELNKRVLLMRKVGDTHGSFGRLVNWGAENAWSIEPNGPIVTVDYFEAWVYSDEPDRTWSYK